MLNILLMGTNYYHNLGLILLIKNRLLNDSIEARFLTLNDNREQGTANIIFRYDMVTIHLFNTSNAHRAACKPIQEKLTIHIPFLCKGSTIEDTLFRIGKILTIARSDYKHFLNKETAWEHLGFKKYAQLSEAEQHVMVLIGRGYNNTGISRLLNRSRKTISTHYRNASRKMGFANRAEFYRYASFIAQCGCDERNTLCL